MHLDFETYSEADLRKVSSHKYARDPSTEIICMGWHVDGHHEVELWLPGEPYPPILEEHARSGAEFWAWNCEFEMPIQEFVGGPMGWPQIPLEQWRDSMALAQTFALPASLEVCGQALGLGESVLKNTRGKQLI
ncbi:unnamed protein product, partial [marine sediment metagenome]